MCRLRLAHARSNCPSWLKSPSDALVPCSPPARAGAAQNAAEGAVAFAGQSALMNTGLALWQAVESTGVSRNTKAWPPPGIAATASPTVFPVAFRVAARVDGASDQSVVARSAPTQRLSSARGL